MSTIPLPALGIRPPADPSEGILRGIQMRSLMNQQALQQQSAQGMAIENQQRQMQLQLQQQQMRDWQTINESLRQAQEAQGQQGGEAQPVTLHTILPGLAGKISFQTYQGLVEGDAKMRKDMADASDSEFKNIKSSHDQQQQLFNNVRNMPQDQRAQNWPYIVRQWNSIPGVTMQLRPDQPMSDDQLDQAGRLLGLQEAYINSEAEKRGKAATTRSAEATAEKTELENQALKEVGGMTQPVADAKYRDLQSKMALGYRPTPQEQGFIRGYEKQKLLVPQTVANIRVEGLQQLRQYPVFDNKTGITIYMNPGDISRAQQSEPGRYTVPQFSPEAIQQKGAAQASVSPRVTEQLRSVNIADAHLRTLQRAAEALDSGDLTSLNAIANQYKVQVGDTPLATYNAINQVVSGDVNRAVSATGTMAEGEMQTIRRVFDPAMPTKAKKAAIAATLELIRQKREAIRQQYEAGGQGGLQFNAPDMTAQPTPTAASDPFSQFGGRKH